MINGSCDGRLEPVDFSFPVALLVFCQGGEICQGFFQARVERFGQQRQDIVTQAIACVGAILVGCVLSPGDGPPAEPILNFGARQFQQRPDQAWFGDRQDARKAGESGAAEDAIQDGFGLIGPGVSGGDALQEAGVQQLPVEPETDAARGLLQVVRQGRDVGAMEIERKSKLFGELANELGVAVRGIAANAVLDMNHAQLQVPARRQFAEGMEQEDGIRAAGDG